MEEKIIWKKLIPLHLQSHISLIYYISYKFYGYSPFGLIQRDCDFHQLMKKVITVIICSIVLQITLQVFVAVAVFMPQLQFVFLSLILNGSIVYQRIGIHRQDLPSRKIDTKIAPNLLSVLSNKISFHLIFHPLTFRDVFIFLLPFADSVGNERHHCHAHQNRNRNDFFFCAWL